MPYEPARIHRPLPALTAAEKAADDVIARLRTAGFAAYRVGGAVRDRLMGYPAEEVDVATSALPDQVCSTFERTLTVGARFGVVIVRLHGISIEVATFRRDEGYSDGRRPDNVRFADLHEDAARRDFTLNALYYDPDEQVVLDFFQGMSDLRRGVIRTVGEPSERFAEDGLRLFRAVRFAARFDFVIEDRTRTALHRCREMTRLISPERVQEEITRMLTGRNPRRAMETLAECGILAEWLPETAAMRGVEQPPEFHPEGDVWHHTMLLLDGLRAASPTLAWAAFLHDVGKPPTFQVAGDRIRFPRHAQVGAELARNILARLKTSRRLREDVAAIIEHHMQFADVGRMRPATIRRMMARPTFPEELELHRLDCMVSHRKLDNYCRLLDALIEIRNEPVLPPPLLRGRDLLDLGIPEGPMIGRILKEVETRRLDGEFHTREEALAWVRQHYA